MEKRMLYPTELRRHSEPTGFEPATLLTIQLRPAPKCEARMPEPARGVNEKLYIS